MNSKKYTLKVYNTITNEYEDVNVKEEIYITYQRTEWNIKNNNKSFFKHEIQLSSLIGGDNCSYENFNEFIYDDDNLEKIIEDMLMLKDLYTVITELTEEEKSMIIALFFEQISERDYSKATGIPQRTINNRKKSILKKIRKLSVFEK